MIFTRNFLLVFFCLLKFSTLFSQELGLPFIRNYTPEEYHGYFQNWAIEQDGRGVMYFANGKGILEYNGKTWRRFSTQRKTTVLSLGKNKKGRIYVGAEGEIGYLAPDSSGQICYVSLLNKVPEKERNFTYVWHTYPATDSVFFVSPEKVILISKTKTRIWKPVKAFYTGFYVNNSFFIVDTERGLLHLKNDSLIPIDNALKFRNVRTVLPYKNKLLIYDRDNGFYIYDGNQIPVHINFEVELFLKKHRMYKGIALPDSKYAFATLNGGIAVMSENGKILHILNQKSGLIGTTVYNLFVDKQRELWAAFENGISRIELSSPFTFFSEKNGLKGIIQDIKRIDSTLYVTSLGGVYKMEKSFASDTVFIPASFNQIPKLNFQTSSIANIDNQFVFSGTYGLFNYSKGVFKNIFNSDYLISLIKSTYHKNVIFSGGSGIFYAINHKNNIWKGFPVFENRTEDIYTIAEQDLKTIWLGTVSQGLLKLIFKDTISFMADIYFYDTLKGVPKGMVEVSRIDNKICIGTENGIYSYNEKEDKFLPDSSWGKSLADGSRPVYLLKKDSNNNLWAMLLKTVGYATKINNKYQWFEIPFLRLRINDLYAIFPESNGVCWIGGTDGIIRYEAGKTKQYNSDFATIIRLAYSKNDTVFRGTWSDKESNISFFQPEFMKRVFSYNHNAFTFEFAAPSFDNEESNSFKFFLEGFDDSWSDWTKITKKEYTNLPEGIYHFKVIGRNIYGYEGSQAVYSFTILPPWYRTVWAYCIYVLLFIFSVYLVVKLNSRRLTAKNIKLEIIVKERTHEIIMQKEEITAQRDEILLKNEILEQHKEEIEAQRDEILMKNEILHQQNEEILTQRDELEIQRNLVIRQKDRIEEIHEEITDSIKYAKNIQNAVLPADDFIKQLLPDHFIFYRPKDIVSGDFYWITKIKNHLVFTVADCTGHGVPGGFMSMMGIAFLSEIINDVEMKSASKILDELRTYIIKSLHQKSGNAEVLTEHGTGLAIKDGMDIALCILNTETMEMQFAGANNPVYIIAKTSPVIASETQCSEAISDITKPDCFVSCNDEFNFVDPVSELVELKGDKMPIGIHSNMQPFTNHIINVKKGDNIYLMSDGFEDQFGGPKNKKFFAKNIKELLIVNCQKPMANQKQLIENAFNEWKGDFDQTDDVTVIGVEI